MFTSKDWMNDYFRGVGGERERERAKASLTGNFQLIGSSKEQLHTDCSVGHYKPREQQAPASQFACLGQNPIVCLLLINTLLLITNPHTCIFHNSRTSLSASFFCHIWHYKALNCISGESLGDTPT